ncbi:MAG TPA: hypothetical protein VLB50_01030 [Ignavibacteriaceae bacterium]|nr:hypothetical protein [Ignavibacteriaceae bacterium]
MKYLINSLAIPLFLVLLIMGCGQKENTPVDQLNSTDQNLSTNSKDFSLQKYNGIPRATLLELQQVKIATAQYHNINTAIADGYEDINVIIPHMGYHFMKAEFVDSTFELDKPELLVYTPNPGNGNMQLVAVEYAVPLSFSQNPPEGFTGDLDVWDANQQFQLWTLHAWIWHYNPDGVFSPMNPLIP